ncbi:hypothetical protein TNCV_2657091 [Trichonephila clavipes]|nr:hypothetical protein TNCV_2657091 [Trichonephila clavipes]
MVERSVTFLGIQIVSGVDRSMRRSLHAQVVVLFPDKALPHVRRITHTELAKFKGKQLDHTPYSPDSSYYDFQKFDSCRNVRYRSASTQGPSESVQEFAARINKLGTKIFQSGNSAQNTAVRNANDQLLQSRFISGLRNDIRRFVISRDPLNLDESINAALIEEQNMKLNQIVNEEIRFVVSTNGKFAPFSISR